MLPTIAWCLLLASQVTGEVEAGIRADSRGGLSPGLDAQSMAPTAEVLLNPGVTANLKARGIEMNAAYAPTVQLRSQWPSTATVLGQHAANLAVQAGDLSRWGQLTGSASLVLGRVDLGTASRLLGQAAGAGVAGTLSIADGRVSAGLRTRPLARVEVNTRATLNVLGLPSAVPTNAGLDPLAWALLPDLSQLTPYAQVEVETSTAWRATRTTTLSTTVRGQGVGQLQPVGYVGLLAFGTVRHQMARQAILTGSLGALGGLEQNAIALHGVRSVVSPYADAQLDVGGALMRDLTVTASVGASLAPTYDLFLAQVTHRGGLRAGSELRWERISVRSSASTFSLLPELALGAARPPTAFQGDAHVVSADLTAGVQILPGLEFGAGAFGFMRFAAHPDGFFQLPSSVLPEVMGFAYIQGQTGLRL